MVKCNEEYVQVPSAHTVEPNELKKTQMSITFSYKHSLPYYGGKRFFSNITPWAPKTNILGESKLRVNVIRFF